MINRSCFRILIQLLVILGCSSTTFAQGCGEAPVKPKVVDGASVTMDQLVANSDAVKSYIAEADLYLDCHLAFRKTVEYKDLARREKAALADISEALLEDRNALGDEFNEQVMAYKEANTE